MLLTLASEVTTPQSLHQSSARHQVWEDILSLCSPSVLSLCASIPMLSGLSTQHTHTRICYTFTLFLHQYFVMLKAFAILKLVPWGVRKRNEIGQEVGPFKGTGPPYFRELDSHSSSLEECTEPPSSWGVGLVKLQPVCPVSYQDILPESSSVPTLCWDAGCRWPFPTHDTRYHRPKHRQISSRMDSCS